MQQKSDRVDDIGQRQKETNQLVSAIARELSSMKTAVEGQLITMVISVAGLTGLLCTKVAESQELLKHKLCEDLLQEPSVVPGLRSTCTHFCQQMPFNGWGGNGLSRGCHHHKRSPH